MDGSQLLTVRHVVEDGCTVVVVSGEIDVATGPEFERALLSTSATNVALDMAGVSFMDSSGIAVILRATARYAAAGGGLTIRNIQDGPLRVMQLTGIVNELTIEQRETTKVPLGRES